LRYHVFMKRTLRLPDEAWEWPLTIACILNKAGWRDVWGKPRGRWHREYRPPEWLRTGWPSDREDRRLVRDGKERSAQIMEEFRRRNPKINTEPPSKSLMAKVSLGEYVDSWLRAEGDFNRWQSENPKLDEILGHTFFQGHSLRQEADGRIVDDLRAVPTNLAGYSTKAATFGFFLLSPKRGCLRKCLRCGRYFLNFGRYERKYCAHRCASANSALKHTRTRRQREREESLTVARRALRGIKGTPPSDWKAIVAEEVGVKVNWVTRAINCQDLKIPNKFLSVSPTGGKRGKR